MAKKKKLTFRPVIGMKVVVDYGVYGSKIYTHIRELMEFRNGDIYIKTSAGEGFMDLSQYIRQATNEEIEEYYLY